MTNTPISEAARELLDAADALDKVEAREPWAPEDVKALPPSEWQRWADQEYQPADDRLQAALNDFVRETDIHYSTFGEAFEAAEIIVEAVSA